MHRLVPLFLPATLALCGRHALGALGEAAWFGAAIVDVLVTASDTPLAQKRDVANPSAEAELTTLLRAQVGQAQGNISRREPTPFSAPRALVYRKRTSTLLVASEGANRVVELRGSKRRRTSSSRHPPSSSSPARRPISTTVGPRAWRC